MQENNKGDLKISFSNELKQQLMSVTYSSPELFLARTHGLLRFSRAFDRERMALQTENQQVAQLYVESVLKVLGAGDGAKIKEYKTAGEKSFFVSFVDDSAARDKILKIFGYTSPAPVLSIDPNAGTEELGAFVSGAFLACGSMVDPQKSYHLEFVMFQRELCEAFIELLTRLMVFPKSFKRRDNFVAYIKDSGEVEDLLDYMGVDRLGEQVMNVKIYKSIRNRVNRAQNCEVANIEKTVNAAALQIQRIEYILQRKGESYLPAQLRELALLRVDNPEMSLRELGDALPQKLSRSGVNHRLRRLCEIYERLKEEENV